MQPALYIPLPRLNRGNFDAAQIIPWALFLLDVLSARVKSLFNNAESRKDSYQT
jgi:hypothetical protein